MIDFPNAKINLGLNVNAKRNDDYHEIESVLFPISLADALEIIPAKNGKTGFASSGLDIPSDGKLNLCQRAFDLLKEEFKLPEVLIHLHKVIPAGSGLGGGSSDAAFTLKMANKLFSLNLDSEKMMQLAAKIGSDCPFFIENRPMLARGRGEILKPAPISLKGMSLLLVKPNVHVSTAQAYADIKPKLAEKSISQIISQPIKTWKSELKNDFEQSVFEKFPLLSKIKQQLYASGAVYAAMSGSGSAIFGIFDKPPKPDLSKVFPEFFVWLEEIK